MPNNIETTILNVLRFLLGVLGLLLLIFIGIGIFTSALSIAIAVLVNGEHVHAFAFVMPIVGFLFLSTLFVLVCRQAVRTVNWLAAYHS